MLDLTARHDANKFNLIAFGQRSLRPFMPMQGEAVVLDQDRLRRQLEALH